MCLPSTACPPPPPALHNQCSPPLTCIEHKLSVTRVAHQDWDKVISGDVVTTQHEKGVPGVRAVVSEEGLKVFQTGCAQWVGTELSVRRVAGLDDMGLRWPIEQARHVV